MSDELNRASRDQLTVTTYASRDTTEATVELEVDGDDVWLACSWSGLPVTVPRFAGGATYWQRVATTDAFFTGPDGPQEDATPLGLGDHPTRTRTTWPDGTEVVEPSTTISVV